MRAMHILNVFLGWWGSFFLTGLPFLFTRNNKMKLLTLVIMTAVIAALMTPLFLTVEVAPSEPQKIERAN